MATMSVETAINLLALRGRSIDTLTPEDITKAYHMQAKLFHPDSGFGNNQQMVLLNEAKKILLEIIKKNQPQVQRNRPSINFIAYIESKLNIINMRCPRFSSLFKNDIDTLRLNVQIMISRKEKANQPLDEIYYEIDKNLTYLEKDYKKFIQRYQEYSEILRKQLESLAMLVSNNKNLEYDILYRTCEDSIKQFEEIDKYEDLDKLYSSSLRLIHNAKVQINGEIKRKDRITIINEMIQRLNLAYCAYITQNNISLDESERNVQRLAILIEKLKEMVNNEETFEKIDIMNNISFTKHLQDDAIIKYLLNEFVIKNDAKIKPIISLDEAVERYKRIKPVIICDKKLYTLRDLTPQEIDSLSLTDIDPSYIDRDILQEHVTFYNKGLLKAYFPIESIGQKYYPTVRETLSYVDPNMSGYFRISDVPKIIAINNIGFSDLDNTFSRKFNNYYHESDITLIKKR